MEEPSHDFAFFEWGFEETPRFVHQTPRLQHRFRKLYFLPSRLATLTCRKSRPHACFCREISSQKGKPERQTTNAKETHKCESIENLMLASISKAQCSRGRQDMKSLLRNNCSSDAELIHYTKQSRLDHTETAVLLQPYTPPQHYAAQELPRSITKTTWSMMPTQNVSTVTIPLDGSAMRKETTSVVLHTTETRTRNSYRRHGKCSRIRYSLFAKTKKTHIMNNERIWTRLKNRITSNHRSIEKIPINPASLSS